MASYWDIISLAAKSAKVSATLLYAICAHESNGFTYDLALYDNGTPSFSVCQIKEGTARMLGWNGKNPMELRNAHLGIKYAALYLKYQQDRYGDQDWCKLTSSYNSGSYIESIKHPGYPKNLKYVNLVKEKLDKDIQDRLNCGEDRKIRYFVELLREGL
jgi:soluble lytic murein transglycosylase-like protein